MVPQLVIELIPRKLSNGKVKFYTDNGIEKAIYTALNKVTMLNQEFSDIEIKETKPDAFNKKYHAIEVHESDNWSIDIYSDFKQKLEEYNLEEI